MDPPFSHQVGETCRLTFGCDLVQAREAAKAVRAFLSRRGVEERDLFACELCLTEACNNAVRYAEANAREQPIVAEVFCGDSSIELRVTDHTPGFDLPPENIAPRPDREHGRGVFIMRSMMNGVRYLRGAGENTLVMWKQRPAPPSRPVPAAARADDPASSMREQLDEYRTTLASMARELSSRSETLAAIFRCGAELGRAGDLEGFARRLLGDLLHLTSSDWYVLRLLPSNGQHLEVFAASDPRLLSPPLRLGAGPIVGIGPSSAELIAASTRAAVPYPSPRTLAGVEPLRAAGPNASGLVHPVLFGDTLVGTLAVGRHERAAHLTDLQIEVVRTLSEFIAIQVVNLRNQEAQAGSKVMSRELEIARGIQQAWFPRELPRISGATLAGRWESASQVAGDFYDALRLGDHSLLLVVADVMGKGVPAAMFATITRALIRALAPQHSAPGELLRRLNTLLYGELSAVDMFITAQLVHIDLTTREIVVANAGHCPALIVARNGETCRAIGPTGTPLGIMSCPDYEEEHTALEYPACLLLHTDGLTEAVNNAGEMFGVDRLFDWLKRESRLPRAADEICEGLASELARFRADARLRDDQTFLVLADELPVRMATDHPARPGTRTRLTRAHAVRAPIL